MDVDDLRNRLHISVFALESWYFGDDLCKQTLLEHFKISSLEGLGLADYDSGVIAAGSLFRYLLDTQKNTMEHMNKIIPYTTDRYMVIDSSSRRIWNWWRPCGKNKNADPFCGCWTRRKPPWVPVCCETLWNSH